ncbi:unnamed protein product [Euphydryas editha]|uniref:Uncharacterized protein n=1 Tax=Euphydryas editha TaxID=104508 RepID=A0AAU9V762_EUPED|nr:unnamed protein product [Euphydryas editha]
MIQEFFDRIEDPRRPLLGPNYWLIKKGSLKILRHKCMNMFGSNGLGVTDEQAKITLRELYTTHTLLLKYSKLFDSLLSPIMFLYVFMFSIMLCACIFQFTIVTTTMQTLLMLQYFSFAIASIFMFCWHSSKVLEQSQQVFMGPYESEWWIMGAKQRKEVLILTGQLKLFPVFSAGPFNKLTISTFVTVSVS